MAHGEHGQSLEVDAAQTLDQQDEEPRRRPEQAQRADEHQRGCGAEVLAEVYEAVEVEFGIRLRQNQARQHEDDEADDGVAHGHALVAGVGRKQRGKLAARNLHGVEQGDHNEDERKAPQGQLGGAGAEQQMVIADGHADEARRGEGDCLRDQKAQPKARQQCDHADDQRFHQHHRRDLARAHAQQQVRAELLFACPNNEPVGVQDQKAQNHGDDDAEIGHDLGEDVENALTGR